MSMDKLQHPARVAILRVLLFRPDARFADLRKASELSSDHFTFHIRQLVEEGYIQKNSSGTYSLTHMGKEFANRFDTDKRTVERQPKVAVCLMIRRKDGRQLVQQRLKQPYYGYWGRPTGKISWGESILSAAARELLEETGLTAELRYESIYHKTDYNKKNGELLEDKIFFIVAGDDPTGELITEFEGGRNAWMTAQEYASQELTFESKTADANDSTAEIKVPIVEKRFEYDPANY